MIVVETLGDLVPAKVVAQLSQLQLDEVVANIAAAARNHWIKLASDDTSHLRFEYISGIQPIEMKPGQATVALVGELAHLLEEGAPRLDLRTTLLGPNVPVAPFGQKGKRLAKAGHYYRAIPFRHMSLGSKDAPRGKTIGQEMGSAYSGHDAVRDSKKLGKDVYKAAKALEPTYTAPGGSVYHFTEKGRPKSGYGGRLPAKTGGAPKLKPHHKSDIYAGMIKLRKGYEQAEQSSYMTFRTISEAVTEGWIRPRIPARNYLEKVDQFVQKIAPMAVEALLEGES